MTNCIFYSLFFVLFLNLSMGSLKMSQVNRTFMSMYRGMFEACTVSINENGEPIVPYYNMDEMETFIEGYFKENLSKYAKDYSVSYKFLNSSGEICTSVCRRVQIHLDVNINTFYKYSKTQTYAIVDGDSL